MAGDSALFLFRKQSLSTNVFGKQKKSSPGVDLLIAYLLYFKWEGISVIKPEYKYLCCYCYNAKE